MGIISKASDKATLDCLVEKMRECHLDDCRVWLEIVLTDGLKSAQTTGFGEGTTGNFIFVSDLDG